MLTAQGVLQHGWLQMAAALMVTSDGCRWLQHFPFVTYGNLVYQACIFIRLGPGGRHCAVSQSASNGLKLNISCNVQSCLQSYK